MGRILLLPLCRTLSSRGLAASKAHSSARAPVSAAPGAPVSAAPKHPVNAAPSPPVSVVSSSRLPASAVTRPTISVAPSVIFRRSADIKVHASPIPLAPASLIPSASVFANSRVPESVGPNLHQLLGVRYSYPCSTARSGLPLPPTCTASSRLPTTPPTSAEDTRLPTLPPICPIDGRPHSCGSSPSLGQLFAGNRVGRSHYHPANTSSSTAHLGSSGVASCPSAFLKCDLGQFSFSGTGASKGIHGVRFYYQTTRGSDGSQNQFQVVDLRSDTLSTPSAEMRSAMARAEVGDDVYGEDPTVNELQRKAAQLFGTEDALFVPSGTMGNLISVMCHCRRRGEELLVGDKAHLHLYEQGGVAQIAGVSPRLVKNLPDGRLDLEDLESKIQHEYPDPHCPHTQLICLENTHNRTGGRVLPLSYHQEVRILADRYGLAVHLDGARLMNAAVALGVAPADIVKHCDSVSLCLSKGLGAPVGSVIGGRSDFIRECLRVRKVLGGGMRQAGVLAAPGLLALSQAENTVKADHRRAKTFAEGVLELASPLCSLDISTVETNIVMLRVGDPRICPQEFCDQMWEVSEDEIQMFGQGVKVQMFVMFEDTVRLVWYCNITDDDTEWALRKLKFVVQKYQEQLNM